MTTNEIANEIANEIGANEIGANEIGANEIGANEIMLENFIDQQFSLRKLLTNTEFHNSKTSINKIHLTPEKEPLLHRVIKQLAKQLAESPDTLLLNFCAEADRKKDWLALMKKEVLTEGLDDIITIDTRTRPGHKILDHHMPHFYAVKNYKGKSVHGIMSSAVLEKALLTNVLMHSTPYKSEIRRMITMTAGLGSVTKYRTVTSKALIQFFGAKRVFDPCTGWGGRMLGCLAAADDTYYVGCEPDKNTYKGLVNILEDYALPFAVQTRAQIIHKPAEDALHHDINQLEKFDMVLTSPPYFNLEVYTDDSQQSITTYNTWDKWTENWLKPVILSSFLCLKPGGVSCWSVKNFKSDKFYALADVTKKIHADAGWTLVKVVAMTGSARPGAKKSGGGDKEKKISEEETFCFRKL